MFLLQVMKGTVQVEVFTQGYEINCPDGFFLVHIMKDTVQVEVLTPNNEKYCPGGCVYSR